MGKLITTQKNNYEDYQVRITILSLLLGHERTFTEIKKIVTMDHLGKEFSKERIFKILTRLISFDCVNRLPMDAEDDEPGKYRYMITDRGRKRLEYYKRKVKMIENAP